MRHPASRQPASSASGPPRRRARLLRLVLPPLGGLAALAAALVWFAGQIPREVADPARETDAIVVLTGGSGRLDQGLALLADGRARKLFVSGVYRGVEVAELLRLAERNPGELECCIALGYEAGDTHGNAVETAAWMRREGFRSLRLVTAAYHMPRSLLEFRRALPAAEIVAHPVFPNGFGQDDWWRRGHNLLLVASEFGKYLVALARDLLAGGAPGPADAS